MFYIAPICYQIAKLLLYIELAISFLIGQKHRVNFWNQCLWQYFAADYKLIVSRTLKVTGNHVMYDCGWWFLNKMIIMSSLCPLCGLPLVKKQNDIQVCKWLSSVVTFLFCSVYNKWLLKFHEKKMGNSPAFMATCKALRSRSCRGLLCWELHNFPFDLILPVTHNYM